MRQVIFCLLSKLTQGFKSGLRTPRRQVVRYEHFGTGLTHISSILKLQVWQRKGTLGLSVSGNGVNLSLQNMLQEKHEKAAADLPSWDQLSYRYRNGNLSSVSLSLCAFLCQLQSKGYIQCVGAREGQLEWQPPLRSDVAFSSSANLARHHQVLKLPLWGNKINLTCL